MAISILLALAIVDLEGREWSRKDSTPKSPACGALHFTITGFHLRTC